MTGGSASGRSAAVPVSRTTTSAMSSRAAVWGRPGWVIAERRRGRPGD